MASLPAGSLYLATGGEAIVYLAEDLKNVIKVNDAVYYATWLEYLIVLSFIMFFFLELLILY